MFGIPSLPPAQGLHPLVVHFPIALLLTAWLPMLIGLVDKRRRGGWLGAGVLMLLLGVLGAFVSTFTGETAASIVGPDSKAMEDLLHAHETTAELARNIFLAVLVLCIIMLLAVRAAKENHKRRFVIIALLLVGVPYIFGALAMINAAHEGGRLVHEFGVRAPMSANP